MKRLHDRIRHVLIFLIIIIMCSSMTSNICTAEVASESDEIKVFLNGERLQFDVNPYIKNSRTLVPFRKIFEAFGLEVQWNPANKTVIATGKGTKILLTINNSKAIVDSKEQKLDAPPEIKNSRTFVPLRFIGESIGAEVEWVAKSRTINISYKAEPTEVISSTPVPTPSPTNVTVTETPTPSGRASYTPLGKYKVGDTATYGNLKFSIDKFDLNLERADINIAGKTNSEQELQFNIYADNGMFIFITSDIGGEKEGDMYKFTGFNYFSKNSNVKNIDRIVVKIRTSDDKLLSVAEYRTN